MGTLVSLHLTGRVQLLIQKEKERATLDSRGGNVCHDDFFVAVVDPDSDTLCPKRAGFCAHTDTQHSLCELLRFTQTRGIIGVHEHV